MVATQNIDTLGPIWTFSLRGVLTFVASGLDINGCVLSYFEGTANLHLHLFTFTFMHLADAFIQSDLHCIEVTGFTFYQLLLSLGIEPMILALLAPCSTI